MADRARLAHRRGRVGRAPPARGARGRHGGGARGARGTRAGAPAPGRRRRAPAVVRTPLGAVAAPTKPGRVRQREHEPWRRMSEMTEIAEVETERSKVESWRVHVVIEGGGTLRPAPRGAPPRGAGLVPA